MPAGSEGVDRKPQSRDPSLTWEIPVEIDSQYHDHAYESCWKAFLDASHEYRENLLREVLEKENSKALLSSAWASNLSMLAFKAVSFLSPSKLKAAGYKNPRNFVKIKRLLLPKVDVVPEPSSFAVNGVVCRKNVAHKRMKPCIENPKILVLLGALEYDKTHDKLSSFDEVIDIERNHLGRLISKIRSLNANLVVVQGGATRTAQELLLEAEITLVSAVNEKLLSRIADCTGARAITLDRADESCMGTCDQFEVRAYQQHFSADDTLSLMYFKGCRTGLASSIVLQGTDHEALALLKKVARHATYIAYWHSIEARFLAEQFLATGLPLDRSDKLIKDALASIQRRTPDRGHVNISPYCSRPDSSKFQHDENEPSKGQREFMQTGETVSDELLLSLSCRNPAKSVHCELPHLFAMPYYRDGDLALDDFLRAAVPFGKRCPHPDCGEGAALHLRSFLHEDGLVTLSSVHLASSNSLSGDGVWMWMRKIGIKSSSDARRILINGDAACISFAHLLTIIFNARDFLVEDINFQSSFVRYFGLGRTVICLNYTKIVPYELRMPTLKLRVANGDDFQWLFEEAKLLAEVCVLYLSCPALIFEFLSIILFHVQESDEIFDLMEDEMKVKVRDSAVPQEEWREAFSRARSSFAAVVSRILFRF
jgi:hypothetical protein